MNSIGKLSPLIEKSGYWSFNLDVTIPKDQGFSRKNVSGWIQVVDNENRKEIYQISLRENKESSIDFFTVYTIGENNLFTGRSVGKDANIYLKGRCSYDRSMLRFEWEVSLNSVFSDICVSTDLVPIDRSSQYTVHGVSCTKTLHCYLSRFLGKISKIETPSNEVQNLFKQQIAKYSHIDNKN